MNYRFVKRHPDQGVLFWICGVCGCPFIRGNPRGHRACTEAFERWMIRGDFDRSEPWINERAFL